VISTKSSKTESFSNIIFNINFLSLKERGSSKPSEPPFYAPDHEGNAFNNRWTASITVHVSHAVSLSIFPSVYYVSVNYNILYM